MTSDTIVVRALYDAATLWDNRAHFDDSYSIKECEARAEEYRAIALEIERTLIGMDGR